mmetsp:Transcript_27586/g.69063  ORF Transcript_27586/g.69063 Transcript_27586/m.69063 type:complete len:83 (+) Transcript_27586:1501-1749(+)
MALVAAVFAKGGPCTRFIKYWCWQCNSLLSVGVTRGGGNSKTFTFDGFPPMQDSKLKGQDDCLTVRLLYITQTSTNPKITKR